MNRRIVHPSAIAPDTATSHMMTSPHAVVRKSKRPSAFASHPQTIITMACRRYIGIICLRKNAHTPSDVQSSSPSEARATTPPIAKQAMPCSGTPYSKEPFHTCPSGHHEFTDNAIADKTHATTILQTTSPYRPILRAEAQQAQSPPTIATTTNNARRNHVGTSAGQRHRLNPRHRAMESKLPSTMRSAPKYFQPIQLDKNRTGNQMRFQRKYGTSRLLTLFRISSLHFRGRRPYQNPLAKKNHGTANLRTPHFGNDGRCRQTTNPSAAALKTLIVLGKTLDLLDKLWD